MALNLVFVIRTNKQIEDVLLEQVAFDNRVPVSFRLFALSLSVTILST